MNVHPTKSEVRFQENSLVYSLVRSTIKHRRLNENLVPNLTVPQGQEVSAPVGEPPSTPGLFTSPRRELAEQTFAPWERGELADPFWRTPTGVAPKPAPRSNGEAQASIRHFLPSSQIAEGNSYAPASTAREEDQSQPPTPTLPEVEKKSFSGEPEGGTATSLPSSPHTAFQLHDSYLVLETGDGMLVIDQHAHCTSASCSSSSAAASGRRQTRGAAACSSRSRSTCPPSRPRSSSKRPTRSRQLGLEVSDFGGNTILLSSYPTLLGRKPPHVILRERRRPHRSPRSAPPTKEALLHLLMATMACKAAVKAGDKLSARRGRVPAAPPRRWPRTATTARTAAPPRFLFSRQPNWTSSSAAHESREGWWLRVRLELYAALLASRGAEGKLYRHDTQFHTRASRSSPYSWALPPRPAVITVLTPLAEVILESEHVHLRREGSTKLDPDNKDRPTATFKLEKKLKGEPPFDRLRGEHDRRRRRQEGRRHQDHRSTRLDGIPCRSCSSSANRGSSTTRRRSWKAPGSRCTAPSTRDGKTVRWAFLHGEPLLRRTFKGTSGRDSSRPSRTRCANKAKPPEPDDKEKGGYGPPVEKKCGILRAARHAGSAAVGRTATSKAL